MLTLPRFAIRMALLAIAGVLSACSAVTFGIANAPAAFGPHERKADIAYGSDARQRLDVYVPKTAHDAASLALPVASGHPVVIFWYGGSWQWGSKSDYRFVGAALANRGYITVLPDY